MIGAAVMDAKIAIGEIEDLTTERACRAVTKRIAALCDLNNSIGSLGAAAAQVRAPLKITFKPQRALLALTLH